MPNRDLVFQSQLKSIEPFTGVSSQDATRWLAHTANILRVQGFFDKNELPLLISGFLDGDALDWFQELPGKPPDWDTFRTTFLQRFPSPPSSHHPFESFQQLSNRRQGIHETTVDYYTHVLKLCHQYNPHMSDVERVDHLKKGLRPSLLEKVLDHEPETPTEFIELVLKAESNQRILQAQLDGHSDLITTPQREYRHLDDPAPPPQPTTPRHSYRTPPYQQPRSAVRSPRRSTDPGTQLICYTCG